MKAQQVLVEDTNPVKNNNVLFEQLVSSKFDFSPLLGTIFDYMSNYDLINNVSPSCKQLNQIVKTRVTFQENFYITINTPTTYDNVVKRINVVNGLYKIRQLRIYVEGSTISKEIVEWIFKALDNLSSKKKSFIRTLTVGQKVKKDRNFQVTESQNDLFFKMLIGFENLEELVVVNFSVGVEKKKAYSFPKIKWLHFLIDTTIINDPHLDDWEAICPNLQSVYGIAYTPRTTPKLLINNGDVVSTNIKIRPFSDNYEFVDVKTGIFYRYSVFTHKKVDDRVKFMLQSNSEFPFRVDYELKIPKFGSRNFVHASYDFDPSKPVEVKVPKNDFIELYEKNKLTLEINILTKTICKDNIEKEKIEKKKSQVLKENLTCGPQEGEVIFEYNKNFLINNVGFRGLIKNGFYLYPLIPNGLIIRMKFDLSPVIDDTSETVTPLKTQFINYAYDWNWGLTCDPDHWINSQENNKRKFVLHHTIENVWLNKEECAEFYLPKITKVRSLIKENSGEYYGEYKLTIPKECIENKSSFQTKLFEMNGINWFAEIMDITHDHISEVSLYYEFSNVFTLEGIAECFLNSKKVGEEVLGAGDTLFNSEALEKEEIKKDLILEFKVKLIRVLNK